MDIILDPPRGAAGIHLGVPVAEAERVLANLPGFLGPGVARGVRGAAHFSGGLTIRAHEDGAGRVDAVEVYRPSDPSLNVIYKGVSIFGDGAERVEAALARHLRLETVDDRLTVVAPDAFLALGKSLSVYGNAIDSGFFESVVVAAPGYYDDVKQSQSPVVCGGPVAAPDPDGQGALF
ncbi:hypothetical protein [Winogradskya humida]|uniref:Uncharacterized protein n=1 Tax=Winogradskya humida TaxID=113566 RepID=A0ABQ4A1K1_9ACTN|nr:hypothetical protein [Actinoplanes humidus]GIE24730.1 hypothetical protein Ahu01nite_078320 [Actinoplanes humidus]